MTTTRHATGLIAEALCRLALRLKGYRIIASRYRSPLGEIDIVAARGKVIAVVEVKARADYNAAASAISPRQQERLHRAAQDFLSHHPQFQNYDLRFDAMLCAPRAHALFYWPVHIKNAW